MLIFYTQKLHDYRGYKKNDQGQFKDNERKECHQLARDSIGINLVLLIPSHYNILVLSFIISCYNT